MKGTIIFNAVIICVCLAIGSVIYIVLSYNDNDISPTNASVMSVSGSITPSVYIEQFGPQLPPLLSGSGQQIESVGPELPPSTGEEGIERVESFGPNFPAL